MNPMPPVISVVMWVLHVQHSLSCGSAQHAKTRETQRYDEDCVACKRSVRPGAL
jgi:hypothetical protein